MAVPSNTINCIRIETMELKAFHSEKAIPDQNDDMMTIMDILEYNYSSPGARGSLVLTPNSQRPISGMHCADAGSVHKGQGFAVVLTYETIASVVQGDFELNEYDEPAFLDPELCVLKFDDSTHVVTEGAISPEEVPYLSSKSKLVKSCVYGCIGLESTLVPAILGKNDPRHQHADTPLLAGCEKHSKLTENFPPSLLDTIADFLWDGWYLKMKPNVVSPKVLTLEEAVVRLPRQNTSEFYKGMDLRTNA
ncbi:hypothetical protein QAD02_001648 [Eretmocerus hayati]|uniref:Uncharacterized protein n=1 Tax=Eretmocerus hayati TaxID=131215 RepID=A0ACC2NGL9_9HYME|nr:hypothetical protein QAD02_001648 [Eretmocerus hayati]